MFDDRFVAVVAADSALGRAEALTVDDLCASPHISASRRGIARGPLDEALEALGRSRRVAAVVPSYAVGALTSLEDDVICLVPRVMAQHLVDRRIPLRWHEVPVELPTVRVEVRWHRRVDNDPASQWLRDHLDEAVRPLRDRRTGHPEPDHVRNAVARRSPGPPARPCSYPRRQRRQTAGRSRTMSCRDRSARWSPGTDCGSGEANPPVRASPLWSIAVSSVMGRRSRF
ncbi:LysR substrate-binding domain-containing protein [Streptomyces sp. NPDC002514]